MMVVIPQAGDSSSQSDSVLVHHERFHHVEVSHDHGESGMLKLWLAFPEALSQNGLRKICMQLLSSQWKTDGEVCHRWQSQRFFTLFHNLDVRLLQCFFIGFLLKARRWGGMDGERLERICCLLGRSLCDMFSALEHNGWSPKLVTRFMNVMTERNILVPQRNPDIWLSDVCWQITHGCLSAQSKRSAKQFYDAFARRLKPKYQSIVTNNEFFIKNIQNLWKSLPEREDNKVGLMDIGSLVFPREPFSLASLFSYFLRDGKGLDLLVDYGCFSKLLYASAALLSSEKRVGQSVALLDCLLQNSSPKANKITFSVNAENKRKEAAAGRLRGNSEEFSTRKLEEPESDAGTVSLKCMTFETGAIADPMPIDTIDHSRPLATNHALESELNNSGGLDIVDHSLDISDLSRNSAELEECGFEETEECFSPACSTMEPVSPINTGSKKRRRADNIENDDPMDSGGFIGDATQDSEHTMENVFVDNLSQSNCSRDDESSVGNVQRETKKVRFSLKHNLVWRPHCPLPPEILRVPPSAMPRGSALKKGVPPGPIRVVKESPRKKASLKKKTAAVRKSKKSNNLPVRTMVLRQRGSDGKIVFESKQ
eukprot:TRINITY_DN33028_c0_g1_i1.p1 TRINITY_DN33028_c0_g1~~TRINITY_DN33028_c0_g1_i1.p1  ORF type:complete len:598 (-),score=90.72 TRINITY_DN33028_c0_g1_i1:242-2035(-)